MVSTFSDEDVMYFKADLVGNSGCSRQLRNMHFRGACELAGSVHSSSTSPVLELFISKA